LLPIFSPGEQAYPENLEPVTPTKARAGDLSDEQKEAIAKMKSFTDFNDLATKSVLGKEGIERQQVRSVVFFSYRQTPSADRATTRACTTTRTTATSGSQDRITVVISIDRCELFNVITINLK